MPTAQVNGLEMHYQDIGDGFPVLFAHSYLWDARMWRPQIDVISQYCRCIVPDLWGHGGSACDDQRPLNVTALAEDHHQLMQQLGIQRYAIVGSSIGGLLGARLAIEHPDAVAGLSILNCYLGEEPAENAAEYAHLLEIIGSLGSVPNPVIDAIAKMMFAASTADTKPALIETFRFDLMTLSAEQLATVVAMGQAMLKRRSQLDRVEEISCPVNIIVGDHDFARPVAEARNMHSQMPDSVLNIIQAAGHTCNLEQDQQVTDALLKSFADNPEMPYTADEMLLV